MDSIAEKLIAAYFEGGNAKDVKDPNSLKSLLQAIIDIVKEEEKLSDNASVAEIV